MKAFPLLWIIHCQLVPYIGALCYSRSVEDPIVEKPGDFIIAGVFNFGELEEIYNPYVDSFGASFFLLNCK